MKHLNKNSPVDREQVEPLINAIQLCLKTPIASYLTGGDQLFLTFKLVPRDDTGFDAFRKLARNDWDEKEKRLTIKNLQEILSGSLSHFLMLSRLRDENMKALARLDPQYRLFVKKIIPDYKEPIDEKIGSPGQASRTVFLAVEKQKMTLRELAQRSDLTQVALSNFKAGHDIRLSSLIKILKGLGLNLVILSP